MLTSRLRTVQGLPNSAQRNEERHLKWRLKMSEDRVPHGYPMVPPIPMDPNGLSPLRQQLELQGQTQLSQLCSRQARAWVEQRYNGG